MSTRNALKVGDRVRYSSAFCRCVGAYSGFFPTARGVVTRLWGSVGDCADIAWDFQRSDDAWPVWVNTHNLERCR
jgi:hypothetical protein